MKNLKDAEKIMKKIHSGSTFFDHLMLGADQDGLVLNYSFKMNSFNYHINQIDDGIFEYSKELQEVNKLQIDENIFARNYCNKNSPVKQKGTLDEAISHVLKAYSKSRLKSVKYFFEEETEEFGNKDESLKGFIKVFKDNFKDFLINENPKAMEALSKDVKSAMMKIGDNTTINLNDKKVNNDFDRLEDFFTEIILNYIDKKIENKMENIVDFKNNRISKNKNKLH